MKKGGVLELADSLITKNAIWQVRMIAAVGKTSWTYCTEMTTSVKTPNKGLAACMRIAKGVGSQS